MFVYERFISWYCRRILEARDSNVWAGFCRTDWIRVASRYVNQITG